MRIPELLDLINQLVKSTELEKKERISLASNIKKQYRITMRDFKQSGKEISIKTLRSLITPLIENYGSIKDLNSINETIQIMVQDYDIANIKNEKDINSIEKEKEKIYATILGNPGTSIDGMSSEYISKIIRRKLTENDGINRDDIINVLNMQSKNMYLNIEEYQKLINDCVISYLTYNKNGVKFLNPKIFDVFQSLASSYKIQGDFEKVKDVYEKSLKIKSLENTLEYKELKNNYGKFLEFMEMKQNFEDRRFDNFESLMNSLTTKFSKEIIFTQAKRIAPQTNQNLTTSSQSNYVMPVEKKLEGFKKLVTALKRYNKDYDIIQCEVGNDAYDGYVILKIENANVSILENFNEVNARIFVVKNEMIDQVRQLTRNDAIALDGVEGINHIENFDNYCRNLIKKTTKLIRETQVGIALPADDEIVFDDNILDKIISDEQKTPIKVNNEVTDIKNTETENEPKKTEKSSIPDLDKVEMERKKAHENRKRLQELEQTLAEIQKNTNKKIADIVNQSEHSQD